MSLVIDERRRAMLAEMGVRMFDAPQPPAGVAPVVTARAVTQASTPAAPRVPSVPAEAPVARRVPEPQDPARSAAIEVMQWDALAQAVASCVACGLCAGRRNTVFGVGDQQADG